MCLAEVYLTKLNSVGKDDAKANGKLYGYKSYIKCSSGLASDYASDVKIGKWMDAEEEIVSKGSYNEYVSGFHIFLNIEDAKTYSYNGVYLVEFENITGIGKNSSNDVGFTVIAKRMRVLRKLKENE